MFLNDPILSETDNISDVRSAIDLMPEKNVYGNRFEHHQPESRNSFMHL